MGKSLGPLFAESPGMKGSLCLETRNVLPEAEILSPRLAHKDGMRYSHWLAYLPLEARFS